MSNQPSAEELVDLMDDLGDRITNYFRQDHLHRHGIFSEPDANQQTQIADRIAFEYDKICELYGLELFGIKNKGGADYHNHPRNYSEYDSTDCGCTPLAEQLTGETEKDLETICGRLIRTIDAISMRIDPFCTESIWTYPLLSNDPRHKDCNKSDSIGRKCFDIIMERELSEIRNAVEQGIEGGTIERNNDRVKLVNRVVDYLETGKEDHKVYGEAYQGMPARLLRLHDTLFQGAYERIAKEIKEKLTADHLNQFDFDRGYGEAYIEPEDMPRDLPFEIEDVQNATENSPLILRLLKEHDLTDYELIELGKDIFAAIKEGDEDVGEESRRTDESNKEFMRLVYYGWFIDQLMNSEFEMMKREEFNYKPILSNMEPVVRRANKTAILESARRRISEIFPETEEGHIDAIVEMDTYFPIATGNNSGLVLSSPELVAKQAAIELNKLEAQTAYKWDLGEFEEFMPSLKELIELNNSSLLVLSNVANQTSGYAKTGYIPFNPNGTFNIDRYIKHNLFLMGLFHKNATKAALKDKETVLGTSRHLRGDTPHYEAVVIPTSSSSKVHSVIKSEIGSYLVGDIERANETFQQYAIEGRLSIIHGDWKPGSIRTGEKGNIVKGNIVDYGLISWGKEIEEVTWFLSESDFNLTKDQVRKYVDVYVSMRSEHDNNFRTDREKHREMFQWADSGMVNASTKYVSVMHRRNLENPTQMDRMLQQIYTLKHRVDRGLRLGTLN